MKSLEALKEYQTKDIVRALLSRRYHDIFISAVCKSSQLIIRGVKVGTNCASDTSYCSVRNRGWLSAAKHYILGLSTSWMKAPLNSSKYQTLKTALDKPE